jgi:4-amino-4-deoxy-L-arabinose transferase-like glycosyltransferase
MAVTQPVWSPIDEAQHSDFIIHLAHGVYPIGDVTLIDRETLGVMTATGTYRGAPPGTYPTPELSDMGPPPPGMSDRANAAWMKKHLWQLSFESVQTPLYYVLTMPIWWAADHLGGPFTAIYLLRIINALLIASLAPMAVAVARVVAPAVPEVAGLAALFAILLPGLDLNGTRISNDSLAIALGALAVLLAVRWVGTPLSWRRAVMLGLVLGAGMMVKLTLAGLFLTVAVLALWPAAGGPALVGRIARGLVSGAIAVLCLAPWLILNLRNYGAIMPGARSARLSDALPSPFTPAFIPFDLAVFNLTYWVGEPLGALPLAAPFGILGGLLALMGLAGLVRMLRVRPAELSPAPVLVATAAVAGLTAVSLLLPFTVGFEFAGPGRYAYPALPGAAAVTAAGIWAVLKNRRHVLALGGFYSVAAVGIMAAGVVWASYPLPGPGRPPSNASMVDASGHGALRGVSITVDRVALDPAGGATWFQTTITNSGSSNAEWSATPVASTGSVTAYGDYLRSTQMPGTIRPGQRASGWLRVPIDPSRLQPGTSVRVRFPDVAVDGYAMVQDVAVDVKLAGSAS